MAGHSLTNTLSEKTLIPISLVVVLLGATAWLMNIHYMSSYNETRIEKLEGYQKEIIDRLASIETLVKKRRR